MKPLVNSFLLLLVCSASLAQPAYWQQYVRYSIEAELDDVDKTIKAHQTIVYKNNSPDTLSFIWFHIWPNAYKNDSTALIKQIRNDSERSKKEKYFGKGWIDGLAFTVNGQSAVTEPHENANYIDVIKLLLNNPLFPGDSVTITTPFIVKLPPYFSRSGYADGEFMVCQWYPKPAVYDQLGWHPFPYLDMGEFYSEYADFDVKVTVPSPYVVGATGSLLTDSELSLYKTIGTKNRLNRNNKPSLYSPTEKGGKKTLLYVAKNVPDFAWFAARDIVVQYDTVKLSDGRSIDAFSYYHNRKKTIWNNSIDYVKDAVKKYSSWIGNYEYPVVQAFEGPANNSSGGMEYPMITLITSPEAEVEALDAVIAHEVGHNWFMSMLGSNERQHTWMDEGLNTYYQFRYEAEKYRSNSIFGKSIPENIKKLPPDQFLNTIYTAIHQNLPMQSAMDIPADQFPNSMEYGIVSYVKTALWMYLLEASVGRDKLDASVKNYFSKWKHKHPQPGDMQAAFEDVVGTKLDEFFKLTKKEGKLE
jgi:hypothetical protein